MQHTVTIILKAYIQPFRATIKNKLIRIHTGMQQKYTKKNFNKHHKHQTNWDLHLLYR